MEKPVTPIHDEQIDDIAYFRKNLLTPLQLPDEFLKAADIEAGIPITAGSEHFEGEVSCQPGGNYGLCKSHPTCELVQELVNVGKVLRDALGQYARFDYYHFLLDRIGQQTDPTKKAREALEAYEVVAKKFVK
jgi:hypothetical protein